MRALVLHAPGRYTVERDWPKPEPREGWARIRVRYSGVCGSDIPRFATTGSYHHPIILGHEFAGTVDAPAPGSTQFATGDPVAILPIVPCGTCAGCRSGEPFHCSSYQFIGSRNDGGFAEYCIVPEKNLFPLPPDLDLRTGAFIEPISVALHVLRRSGFAAGQSALVFGAGAIGLLIGLWLKVFGAAHIVFSDLREESLELARRLGFEETVNPEAMVPGAASPGGFDAVFEAAGSSRALLAAIDHVRAKGSITVVGRDTADTQIPLAMFERFMRRELTLRGCWGYNLAGDEAFLFHTLREGRFPIGPLMTHEVELEEAPTTIASMIRREMYYCKVIVRI